MLKIKIIIEDSCVTRWDHDECSLDYTIAKSFIDANILVTIQLPSSVQYGINERSAVLNRKKRRRGQGIIKSDMG